VMDEVVVYINMSQILYSVKCQENPNFWYCNANVILKQINENAKEQ